MVNRTFPVLTRTARHWLPDDGMARLIQRSPTPGISRAKDGNARRIYSIGNMSRPGIVADKEIQFTNQRSQPTERGLAHDTQRLPGVRAPQMGFHAFC